MGFDMHGKNCRNYRDRKNIKILLFKPLRTMGLKVLAYDIFPDHTFAEKYEIEYCGLDYLYANADIISLHCPLTKDTEYIINETSIAKMKTVL